jgi:hypothetical protein
MQAAMKYLRLDSGRLFLMCVITLLCVHCPEGFSLSKAVYVRSSTIQAYKAATSSPKIRVSTHLKSSLSADMDDQNSNRNQMKKQLKLPSVYINTIGMFALGWVMKTFTKRWIFVKAGKKFVNAG